MTAAVATTVARFRPGADDAEVLALRAQVWGADHPHSPRAFFRWLFGPDNPAGPGSGILLRRGGQLVGFAGLCPRLARCGGREVRVAHGLDYMVQPALSAAASGRFALRVAAEWADLARAGAYDFGINFPNFNSRRLLMSDRLGWQPALAPGLMLRPLGARSAAFSGGSALRRAGLRAALSAGAGVAALRGWAGGSASGGGTGQAVALDLTQAGDAARVEALWARVGDAQAGLVRDARALRWRYGAHPLYRYQVWGWAGPQRLEALLVTVRRPLFGMDCRLIADVLADPAHPAAAARLIARTLRGCGAALAVAQAGPDLAPVLARAGFVRVPARVNPKPFVMVTLPLAMPAPADWRFGWGDMDVI